MDDEIIVCPPRDFVWSKLAAGTTQTIVLDQHIDCTGYDQADLTVRVHSDSTIPCYVKVHLVSDGFTPDDPNKDFYTDPILTISLTGSLTAPKYYVDTITDGLGAMLAVQIEAKQHASVATAFTTRLSIGAVLRKV